MFDNDNSYAVSRTVYVRDGRPGYEVLVLPRPTQKDQEEVFEHLNEARCYARGLSKVLGWAVFDDATESAAPTVARRRADRAARDLLQGLDVPVRRRWAVLRSREA